MPRPKIIQIISAHDGAGFYALDQDGSIWYFYYKLGRYTWEKVSDGPQEDDDNGDDNG